MQKYILVTASSKGLGLEIAKRLSFDGYSIILTSRSEKNLRIAHEQLNKKVKHQHIVIDFSKNEIEENLIDKIKDLNIVAIVHNYGIKMENDTHPIDIDILNQTINNNFSISVLINNKLFEKPSREIRKIIYIGSTASLHAKASPSYTLSKSLINSYVKNSSFFYLEKNISICAILPGIMGHKNSEWDKKKNTENQKYLDKQESQPLKRFSMPEEVASYISGIVSIDNFLITGSILKLDANDY